MLVTVNIGNIRIGAKPGGRRVGRRTREPLTPPDDRYRAASRNRPPDDRYSGFS